MPECTHSYNLRAHFADKEWKMIKGGEYLLQTRSYPLANRLNIITMQQRTGWCNESQCQVSHLKYQSRLPLFI